MGKDIIHTQRQLPVEVLVVNRPKLVLATADIYRTPEKVLIQITAKDANGQILAEYLEQEGPIGLSFSAVPVRRT